MMRWSAGEATVERLLAAGHIERVQGAQADGESWLTRARRGLEAARILADGAPDSSVVLAYDAARQACVALLAQQGLRPTTAGGHYAIEEIIRAQFGPALRAFGGLRRRRNELEYPLYPTEQASPSEAAETLKTTTEIIDAAAKLLPNLGFF
jgi:HEPN domain-containing protein